MPCYLQLLTAPNLSAPSPKALRPDGPVTKEAGRVCIMFTTRGSEPEHSSGPHTGFSMKTVKTVELSAFYAVGPCENGNTTNNRQICVWTPASEGFWPAVSAVHLSPHIVNAGESPCVHNSWSQQTNTGSAASQWCKARRQHSCMHAKM